VFFDAFFCINRPLTLKGGPYYQYYFLYDNYIKYDTLYDWNNDRFIIIQSWLNVVEGILHLFAVLLSLSSSVKTKLVSAFIAVLTSTMVFWKTVIFVWYDDAWTSEEAKNFSPGSLLCYYLPNSFWIIMPIVTMYVLPRNIIRKIPEVVSDVKKVK